MNYEHDLLAHFQRYFEIIRADTDALREQAYRLRYQVYCHEGCMAGFKAADYPDGLEQDRYDHHSVHCLLLHRPSHSYAGTVRLVLADRERLDTSFPVEEAAGESIDRDMLASQQVPRRTIAECSRFILTSRFRSRPGEQQWPDGLAEVTEERSRDERRAPSHPILGLFKACVMMSWEHGIRYWYAGMEPRLQRRLRPFGWVLHPVSPVVDYHGPCRAYWGHLPDMLTHVNATRPDVWALVTDRGEIWPATASPSDTIASSRAG